MHRQAYEALGQMLAASGIDLAAPWKVLNAGGRDVNYTLCGLDVFAFLPAARWTGADITPGPGVTLVADLTRRPWEHPADFDVAVCTEVFEHVEKWPDIVANLADAVRRGGLQAVFITCAGPGRPAHGASGEDRLPDGEWYGNVPPGDLEKELGRYFAAAEVRFGPDTCDTYAWARGVLP